MIIVDTNTGQKLEENVPFRNVNGTLVILKVDDRVGKARVLRKVLARNADDPMADHMPPVGDTRWVPLLVRYTHPAFFLRRVGFYPS